jgi:hypothetical protein
MGFARVKREPGRELGWRLGHGDAHEWIRVRESVEVGEGVGGWMA